MYMQLVELFEKSHHFVLKNTGTTEISFQITNELKSHFMVTTAPCTLKNSYINLKPNESIAVCFSLAPPTIFFPDYVIIPLIDYCIIQS